jgi:hypothetical protein
MGKSVNSQTKKLIYHVDNLARQKQRPYRNIYIGRERERHEILLIDSDDSMAGIKLVDLHEFTERFGL